MIDLHLAIAIALVMMLFGAGGAWWFFYDDLRYAAKVIEESEKVTAELVESAEAITEWRDRALNAEQSLELVLGEGESRPLTAPLQVIRGGIR